MRNIIKQLLREGLLESNPPNLKVTKEMKEFISQFDSDEQLLRSGGLPIEILDRAAHGFSEEDIVQLHPSKLNVRWIDDLENVEWEVKKMGIGPVEYSKRIDLSEPVDVEYWEDSELGFKRGFYIQDGHHRYFAAKTLGLSLNIKLEIKINPITELAKGLDYDTYHRYLFKQIKY